MQWLMKCCARGALGLGAAALLLAGVPAHARSACRRCRRPPPGKVNRSGWLRAKAQPEAAEQLEKRRLKEQQKGQEMEQQQKQEG